MNGIQEVSGSIPLISTRRIMKGLISSEIKPFCFLKNEYWDDAGSFPRRSSILPPTEIGRFHESRDRESGLFSLPGIVSHGETYFSFGSIALAVEKPQPLCYNTFVIPEQEEKENG